MKFDFAEFSKQLTTEVQRLENENAMLLNEIEALKETAKQQTERVEMAELAGGGVPGSDFQKRASYKIQAIKLVRIKTNWNLRESKTFVENLMDVLCGTKQPESV